MLDKTSVCLKQYGKDKDYAFILKATESSNIVYATESTNIAEDVLKGLDVQYDNQYPNDGH